MTMLSWGRFEATKACTCSIISDMQAKFENTSCAEIRLRRCASPHCSQDQACQCKCPKHRVDSDIGHGAEPFHPGLIGIGPKSNPNFCTKILDRAVSCVYFRVSIHQKGDRDIIGTYEACKIPIPALYSRRGKVGTWRGQFVIYSNRKLFCRFL